MAERGDARPTTARRRVGVRLQSSPPNTLRSLCLTERPSHKKGHRMRRPLLSILVVIGAGCSDDNGPTAPSSSRLGFFVTSATSMTGNLGGLAGADATCQRLASAAGQGSRTWRAYLSVERDPANNNQPTHARDRIGSGPWYNASLKLVANTVAELHSRTGDA